MDDQAAVSPMEWLKAKSILQRIGFDGNQWFGIDYSMNLYKGCSHGCIYCDSRSDCYHVPDFDRVRGKKDAALILEQELSRKRQKGIIGIGAMSDAYNPQEAHYGLTREALAVIARYGFGLSLETKSALITRDIDLLQQISRRHSAIIKLTVTTVDDRLARIIEPRASAPSRRLEAIGQLRQAGLYAGILLTPVLPWITDQPENIIAIVEQAHQVDAQFIYGMWGVTLRENQQLYYYDQLDRHFPGLRQRYEAAFGSQYVCSSPQAAKLEAVFQQHCARYGIRCSMEDIIAGYKPPPVEQLELF